MDVNTIANRTLISNETNGKIKDKAPADYLSDDDIFPSGARVDLLEPHFIDEGTLPILQGAREDLPDHEVADLYSQFVQARQAAMIEEIRRACGITAAPPGAKEEDEPDEAAADIREGTAPADEVPDDLELLIEAVR